MIHFVRQPFPAIVETKSLGFFDTSYKLYHIIVLIITFYYSSHFHHSKTNPSTHSSASFARLVNYAQSGTSPACLDSANVDIYPFPPTQGPRAIITWFQSSFSSSDAIYHLNGYQSPLTSTTNASSSPSEQQQEQQQQQQQQLPPLAQNISYFLPHVLHSYSPMFYRLQFMHSTRSSLLVITNITVCPAIAEFVLISINAASPQPAYIQLIGEDRSTLPILERCIGGLLNAVSVATQGHYLFFVQGDEQSYLQRHIREFRHKDLPSLEHGSYIGEELQQHVNITHNCTDPVQEQYYFCATDQHSSSSLGKTSEKSIISSNDLIQSESIPTSVLTQVQTSALLSSPGPQYITSGTLVVLGFSAFILIFALFGFYFMMDVQGPLRYPIASHLPLPTREY